MELRIWMLLVCALIHYLCQAEAFNSQEKTLYKNKVLNMFSHAFHSYMDHAYPADELMPLTCKGRVRGRDRNRGDIDDALGMFSLTLVDSLDTLAVMGRVDEFNSAIKTIIRDISFDRDVVVSVFETNIRVLGGLLGAHFAAEALKDTHPQLSWYNGHLLRKAVEVGRRLLPAFNTSTGLPYPKVNLRHGMGYHNNEKTTCTACAGTLLLEFAALSRITGDPEYEMKAHQAMEVLWQSRHQGHNLLGTVINVHNGEWTRRDSGVGAGSDSYYEYVLKSYILLGDPEYLKRFQMHYGAIKKYISNGPLLVDVSMNSPTRMTRSYMDSLLAFWPGLQVLWGDVDAAIQTHDMLYHVTEKHNFLPEAFTLDFRVHWGNHPLRPEFSESTYFLYRATKDPYYLDVGKTIVDNLNEYARVSCGFAAIKDLRNNEHEDRMDSFVLAETFKYLFLLFAEDEDVPLDLDDFLFTTEAHLFPLSLASTNSTLNRVVKDAQLVMRSTPAHPHSANTTQTTNQQETTQPSDKQHKMQTTPTTSATDAASPASSDDTSKPPPPPSSPAGGDKVPPPLQLLRPPPQPSQPPSLAKEGGHIFTIKQLQCPNDHRPFVLQDQFEKLILKQCTSSRFKTRPAANIPSKRTSPPRLDVRTLDFSNREQLVILSELGIVVEPLGSGKVQVSHLMQKAKTPEDAEEGWFLMQDIMKLMSEQKKMQEEAGKVKHSTSLVQILEPSLPEGKESFEAGSALFGPILGVNMMYASAELYVKLGNDGSGVDNGCQLFSEEEVTQSKEKVVMMVRGGCLFVQKVRNAQKAGAVGAIIADNIDLSHDSMAASHDPISSSKRGALPFSMSGDGVEDVEIPSVFMRKADAQFLQDLMKESEVIVRLTSIDETEEDHTKMEDKMKEEEEGLEGVGQEDKKKEEEPVEEDLSLVSNDVKVLSRKVKNLLEGLDPNILPDELKDSVAKELSKYYEYGGTESAVSEEEEEKRENVIRERNRCDGGGVCHDDTCTIASQSDSEPGPG